MMDVLIRLPKNANITAEELQRAFALAQKIVHQIDIKVMTVDRQVVILRDEDGKKVGEMGVM